MPFLFWKKKQYKINWFYLSRNINAISLLEKNLEKIDWSNLSCNINAISILEKKHSLYQLSVISYQLSVISYQLSVISYQLSVCINYHLSDIS